MGTSKPHLYSYSRLFSSVEGNTSFYAMPDAKTLDDWAQMADPSFRFTFKFPKDISHQGELGQDRERLLEVLNLFARLQDKLGVLMLQLPASFSPAKLGQLEHFLTLLPKDFQYAVEVRNLDFFDKSVNERKLNQLLMTHQVNRVIMDTRGLFACQDSEDELVLEVQSKKPKVPTNVIATGQSPIVRYVGHPELSQNRRFYQPWLAKLRQWVDAGLKPYLFFHMPDNALAPWLAEAFFEDMASHCPAIPTPRLNLPKPSSEQLDIFAQ